MCRERESARVRACVRAWGVAEGGMALTGVALEDGEDGEDDEDGGEEVGA